MNRINIKIVKIFSLTILVLQPLQAAPYLKNYLQNDFNYCENRSQVLKILFKQIEKEDNFSTCVALGKALPALPVEEFLQKGLQKVMIVHADLKSFVKCCDALKHFLVVVYWHEQTSLDLLNDMAFNLDHKRQNKILVIKNAAERFGNTTEIDNFFKLSKLFKFSNLVLIFNDFQETHNLYQFQIFPSFSKTRKNFKRNDFLIFPRKIKNLQGAALKTIPDQILPKTAAFRDHDGQMQVKGYVIKFLLLFSKYLNATLQFPLNITIGKPLELRDIFNLTHHNIVDVPASLLSCQSPRCSQLMSDTYEINKLCLMVPLEQPYSYQGYANRNTNRIYLWAYVAGRAALSLLLVISTKVWSIRNKLRYQLSIGNVLINGQVVAGMVGASFKLVRNPSKSMRIIYISLFLFGLINTIVTCSRLQTFLTHPFSYRIHTLQDLVPHNLRVLITQYDYHNLLRYCSLPPEQVALIFKTVSSPEEFYQIQSSFNTSYAYPIASPLWFMFDALQKYRNKPLFRLTDICFPFSNLMTFMLPSNSEFLEPLNQFIARVHDMGLSEHWVKTSYIDLIKIEKIYIPKDRIAVRKSFVLVTNDMRYFWNFMLWSHLCALIIFMGELLCNRLQIRRRV